MHLEGSEGIGRGLAASTIHATEPGAICHVTQLDVSQEEAARGGKARKLKLKVDWLVGGKELVW